MPDAHEPLVTRDLAAHAVGVTPSTVHMWSSRGWVDRETGERRFLEVVKRDWRGRNLYRLTDVMVAESKTRGRGPKRLKRPDWSALNANSSGMQPAY